VTRERETAPGAVACCPCRFAALIFPEGYFIRLSADAARARTQVWTGRRACPKPRKPQETSLARTRWDKPVHTPSLPRQRAVAAGRSHPHMRVMQHLDLTDEEAAVLTKELANITGNDRYPFSARIQTLKAIRAKLRPELAREPLPPSKHFEPPSMGRYKRRGWG
jgi:hypothetical protein